MIDLILVQRPAYTKRIHLLWIDPSEPTNAPVISPNSVSLIGLRVTLSTMLKSLGIPRTRLLLGCPCCGWSLKLPLSFAFEFVRFYNMTSQQVAYMEQSRGPLVQGVMWTMSIVPLFFVCGRLYVRVCLKRVFGWDDFIIIVAIVSNFPFPSCVFINCAELLIFLSSVSSSHTPLYVMPLLK